MARTLQFRRGNTAVASAFTGAEGELFVNTTTDTIHVQDGTTAGGHALAKASDIVSFDQDLNTTDNVSFANIVTSTGQITVPTDTDFALRLNHSTFGEANVIVNSQGYMEITGGYTGTSFTQIQSGEVGAIGYFGFTGNVTNINGINGLILDTGFEGSGGTWTFDTNGDLGFPGSEGTNYVIGESEGGLYISSSHNLVLVTDEGTTDKQFVFNTGGTFQVGATEITDGYVSTTPGNSLFIVSGAGLEISANAGAVSCTLNSDGVLDLAGKLRFPNGAEIRDTSGDLRLRSSSGNVTQLQGIDNSGFVDSAVKAFYDGGSYVTINTNIDSGSPEHVWSFDYNGDLTVPNYIKFAGNTFIGDEPGAGTPIFRIVAPLGYGATIETDSDIEGNNYVWSFGSDGTLTFPDSTVQSTAYTGTVDYANVSGAYGDSNVASFLSNVGSNSISTTGNVTAGYFIGNGSQLTGLPANYGNTEVAAYLTDYTGNIGNLKTTSNVITTGYFIGNGSQLTGISGGSLTGITDNANSSVLTLNNTNIQTTRLDVRYIDNAYDQSSGNELSIQTFQAFDINIKTNQFSSENAFRIDATTGTDIRHTESSPRIQTQSYGTEFLNGVIKLPVSTSAPGTPAQGMVAIADGATWDPSGANPTKQQMVVYLGSAWVQIAIEA